MKLSSRKELLNEAEKEIKKIRGKSKKESLKEASVFSSLLNTITKKVVDKFGSDRDILLPIARDMFTKMKNEMKNKNMDDAKLKKALNIIDKVERETITKVGSFQIKSFSEMEKYILDSISAETQKQNVTK
jgi:hypothetical protein